MDINVFAVKVARMEKGKKEVSIAQIKEILKIVNKLTRNCLYQIIRWM